MRIVAEKDIKILGKKLRKGEIYSPSPKELTALETIPGWRILTREEAKTKTAKSITVVKKPVQASEKEEVKNG